MTITLNKFGNLLNGRPTARENYLRLVQMLSGITDQEEIILDLNDVEIITPSYAGELFHSLTEKFGNRVRFVNAQTAVVKDTIKAII